jgi:hypothetical protein
MALVVLVLELRFGATHVPVPHFGSSGLVFPPVTLLATLFALVAAIVSSLNSDVYVAGACDVEKVFGRLERLGFVTVTAVAWLFPETLSLFHHPHHGTSSYVSSLLVLLPLAWGCSALVGAALSWLTPLIYSLAALMVGGSLGPPSSWDWWRALSLSRSGWTICVGWAVVLSAVYIWWGPRRRVADIDV